jgi:hypothetical protein
MRLLSWTSFWILSTLLCVTCLAEPFSDRDSNIVVNVLDERQTGRENRPSTTLATPAAKPTDKDAEGDGDEENTLSATRTAKPSRPVKTSEAAKTSAIAKPSSAATTKKSSDKTTTPTSSPSESTEEATTRSESSTSTPLKSPSPTSSPTSSTSASSTSSTSTNVPQPTSTLRPQPQSANKVSVGGIAAGVVLGAAVFVGIVWIAFAKWRENKRRRNQFGDAEAKGGFPDPGADGHYSSSQDSLLAGAGGKPSGRSNGLRMQALSPSSRAHSFVSSYPERPGSHVPQDVLPPTSPTQYKNLPQLPEAEPQFSTPLGSHPHIAEMPSPYSALLLADLQAGRSVPRKPLPQINAFSPVNGERGPQVHQQRPTVELPG